MAGVVSIGTPGLTEPLATTTSSDVAAEWAFPDRRRALQLALAALWLLDGVLQLQPFMFTRDFGAQTLAGVARGNPAGIASSITWVSQQVAAHPGVNLGFAVIQLAIGVGIAWRRTVRAALAVSVGWAIGVWWFGEGLGGLVAGTAHPLTGAPGAALLYALLAVLLWPVPYDRIHPGTAVARRPVGPLAAALAWVAVWGSLAWGWLGASNRAPGALSAQLLAAAAMSPGWSADLDRSIAGGLAGHGLPAAIVLAVLSVLVALAVIAPARVARPLLVLGMLLALATWILGESFGGIVMGQATDPNTGPLLVLLAAAYWPVRRARPAAAGDGGGA